MEGATTGLANRCGTSRMFQDNPTAMAAISQLESTIDLATTYQAQVAKAVGSGNSSSAPAATEFFGKLLLYCPRLNMELAYNEFVTPAKTGGKEAEKYFQPLKTKNPKANPLCEKEIATMLGLASGGTGGSENPASGPSSAEGSVATIVKAPATESSPKKEQMAQPAATSVDASLPASVELKRVSPSEKLSADFAAIKQGNPDDKLPEKANEILAKAGLTEHDIQDTVGAYKTAKVAYEKTPNQETRKTLDAAEGKVKGLEKIRRKARNELDKYSLGPNNYTRSGLGGCHATSQ